VPPIRCEVLRRDGPETLPCLVRTDDGRTLRLFGDDAPPTARWLGTLAGAPVWAVRVDEPPDVAATPDEVLLVDVDAIDEVGVAVGPDEQGIGLFDVVRTESSLTGEPTGVAAAASRSEQRRTQILAWIAAQPPPAADPATGGEPCAALKRLVADEPLDPIPALDGGPRRPVLAPAPKPPEPEATSPEPTGPEVTVPRIEPEDTATAVEVSVERTVTVSSRVSPSLVVAAAVVGGALSIALWRAFG
jgi:hypothetical protein